MQSTDNDSVILEVKTKLEHVLSDLTVQTQAVKKLCNKLEAKSELSDSEEEELDSLDDKIDILEARIDAIDHALLALSDY